MTRLEFEKLLKPLVNIIDDIELELIYNILNRVDNYKEVKGSLKWYNDKLKELKILERDNKDVFKNEKKEIEDIIKEIAEHCGKRVDNFERLKNYFNEGLLEINPTSLFNSVSINNLIEEAVKDSKDIMNLIQTKAIEASRKEYINVLNQAYVETASGVYTYTDSIKRAIDKFSTQGISTVHYKNGSSLSIESVTRRDIVTRMNKLVGDVEIEQAKELGTNLVYVDQHLGARVRTKYTKEDYEAHAEWQGKKYLIEGSSKEYGNLYEKTGYGEMLGLKGINCYHHMMPTFEWEEIPEIIDEKENKKQYELFQKQRAFERKIRTLKRKKEGFKAINNEEEYNSINEKYQQENSKYDKWLRENNLSRDYNREYTIKQTNVLGQSSSNNISKSTKQFVEKIELDQINKKIKEYNDIIKNSDVEFAYVIQQNGEVYSFKGNKETVNIYDIEYDNAIITHNHLKDKYDDMYKSFGEDDLIFLKKHPEVKELQEINEEYSYSVKVLKELDIDKTYARNKGLELMIQEVDYGDEQHYMFKWLRNEGYVDYERINNRTKEKD